MNLRRTVWARPRGPLTEEQRRLVEAHLWIARARAGIFAARGGRVDPDTLYAAACAGLVAAARTYDPAAGASYATHATRRADGAIRDELIRIAARGLAASKAVRRGEAPVVAELDRPGDLLGESEPVGWEIEYEDEVEWMARAAGGERGEALRRIYLHAATAMQKDAGAALGVTKSRAGRLHAEAVEAIRGSMTGMEG